jgi:hypothetical protein
VLNRAGLGSVSPNCPSFLGDRGFVTSHMEKPSVLGAAELHVSLLCRSRSPLKNGVFTLMTWMPSPG